MQNFTTNMTIHILYGIVGQLNTLYQGKSPVKSIVIFIVELFIEFVMHFSVNLITNHLTNLLYFIC